MKRIPSSCSMPSIWLAACVVLSLPAACLGYSHAPATEESRRSMVDKLLGQMTLAEKAGQLEQESGKLQTGPNANSLVGQEDRVAAGQIGSILNTLDVKRLHDLQEIAVEKSRLHIPLIFAFDVIHGFRTTFPVPLGLAATWNPDLIQETAHAAAAESARNGIRWTFSPMVDIARDARWGRIVEGSGEDPYLGSAIAAAYIHGYQGSRLDDPDSIAACVKHFAGYGAVTAGREYNAVDMSELTLHQFYLPPFRASVDAGAATVMSAFNTLNGVPSTANSFLLRETLRDQWKFRGVVVSDWGAVPQLQAHGVANSPAEAARKAMLAGLDMDMVGKVYPEFLPALVTEGKIPIADVDDAVRRVLQLKADLGLFDHPYFDVGAANQAPSRAHLKLAETAAEQSIVLLKNFAAPQHAALLPMRPNQSIALIGPLGDSAVDMLGSWIADGQTADVVTVRSALQARVEAAHGTFHYAQGTEITTDAETGFAPALAAVNAADMVVMALGESGPNMSGEGGSRTRLDLPGNQQQLLEKVVATGKPVVLVLFNGHPLAVPWVAEHVPAILEAWFPGDQAGPALVNVLFGDTNPSGHLPVTIPRSVGQEPLFYNQDNTGRPVKPYAATTPPNSHKNGISRYIDELDDPLFAFGWGLSYTTFAFHNLTVSRDTISAAAASGPETMLTVAVDVENTGTRSGDDVVQLYLHRTGTSVAEPLRELRAFRRVSVAPGRSTHLQFALTEADFAVAQPDGTSVLEPLHADIYVGDSSLATDHASFDVLR